MTIDFYAGMVPTADDFADLVASYVTQSVAATRISTVTVADSAIICPVDGLTEINLSARWTSLGGGIRWCWRYTGTVALTSRDILSAGQTVSANTGTAAIRDIRLRQIATINEEQLVTHFDNAATQLIQERLIVSGGGEVVFQFAQNTSNANATTLASGSFATVQKLRQL
ncbi:MULTISPECIES: hypothetical protein [unclassified Micromonospora]|uniref:hypothetical protein n=1 Tax=unclassified Micromonospora TaxID=2617518 RepID=UPI001033762F|nr:hypothetical protein [Verrucosispora sp. SN26_14.1]TBL44233.1 hypothetical protein EYA84_01975 [Verrucosispora sp. SN26_14.1]